MLGSIATKIGSALFPEVSLHYFRSRKHFSLRFGNGLTFACALQQPGPGSEDAEDIKQRCIGGDLEIEIEQAMHQNSGAPEHAGKA
jgi:hypothetical protein